MKISVFIPSYNAAAHIENVLGRFPVALNQFVQSIYIINDGSTDASASIINNCAEKNRHIVPIHFDSNRGYGHAVREGLKHCMADGCNFAVCMHADEQYPPESILDFVMKMEKNKIDIMQGSRIASGTAIKGGMPLYKFIAGKMLTFLENRILRLKLTDYHSGFLIYSRNALSVIQFELLSTSFDFDLEVLACARTSGLSVAEMPIPTRYASEHSYLNPVTYGIRALRMLYRFSTGYYKRCIVPKK